MKIDLRIKAKELRKTLAISDISNKLAELICNHNVYKQSKNVMLYYPLEYEVNLLSLVNDNKKFYLPRVNGKNLDVCEYHKNDELKQSPLKIYEPVGQSVDSNILDLIIVPALMVDKEGFRLGYGGGYYDRFLSKNPDIKTLCAIPKQLYADLLPHDVYDVKIDYVIVA